MYPKSFEYISPKNIDDVISLLDKYKEDAKLINEFFRIYTNLLQKNI